MPFEMWIRFLCFSEGVGYGLKRMDRGLGDIRFGALSIPSPDSLVLAIISVANRQQPWYLEATHDSWSHATMNQVH